MKKKKIIVLGFMGGMPIAGVIWQHIHYIVGLQRLGHEVTYVEDTLNYPYDPVAFNVSDDYSYAAQTLGRLAKEHGFEGRWAYCARYKENPEIAGMSLEDLRRLYREADCALNICGSHDMNDDLRTIRNLIYVESDPGVEQIKIDKGGIPDRRLPEGASSSLHLRRKHRNPLLCGPDPRFPVASDPSTRCHLPLVPDVRGSRSRPEGALHDDLQLVHQREKGH